MKTVEDIIAAASSLSAAERLQLVEAIWDSLLESPDTIPVPDWHRQVLDERRNSPAEMLDWEEVKDRLRKRSGEG
jgi:putative addiction module component (TIGR02574 family)